MSGYNCVDELMRKLSAAVDSVESRAKAYTGKGPYRVLIDDLAEEHGLDRQYAPLLGAMLRERRPGMDVDVFEDEIMLYADTIHEPAFSIAPERAAKLLDSALDFIGEISIGFELYDILKNTVGMTDDEIKATGFELSEYFEEPEQGLYPQMEQGGMM